MVADAATQIELFKEFLSLNYENSFHELIQKGATVLEVDFSLLLKFNPKLADELLDEPEETIKAGEIALDQFDLPEKSLHRIRLFNLPESQKVMIRDIRSIHLDQLTNIEGIVRQSSDVRPQVTSAKFECPSCGNTISILQLESKFKEPSRCSCGRRGKFRLLSKELVDAQHLRIEEAPESLIGGEQPKRISVFLKEDLVDPKMEKRTTPGSKVSIIGIIKEIPILSKTGGQSTRYDLIIETNNIIPLEEDFSEIEINEETEKEILKLAKDPKVYEKLINSMAPSIYGHENVKEALILQLLGGVKKTRSDGTFTRGDMHMLLVGDPGAAKSSMLIFVSKMAPKARYVAGRSASGAGITASVVKDEFLRGWALEAGAIVLANKGILCLDEMDKMSVEDTSALHEAMAQQTISISKANIQATLRAETAVLAAANPKLGRFDPYTPIAAQIDLPPALINRFDLIFPIRDLPNKEIDEKIASHVLTLQQSSDNLKVIIAPELLRKFISYAKQKVFPVLTQQAVDEIKSFYVNLRNSGQAGEDEIRPIPISARQLEALVRLAEGSARARLSEKVTRQDAIRAIQLLKNCLMQVGFDYETGQIDIDRISTGITASTRNKMVAIREIINDFNEKGQKSISLEEINAEASEKGITQEQVEEIIEKMKRDGSIFEPRRGFISKI